MRKEVVVHLLSFVVFFALTTLIRWSAIPPQSLVLTLGFLWLGGIIGTFLPDVDHLIYIYFLKPHELTSQRATNLMQQGQVVQTASLLVSTQDERQNMIFHTIWFQLLFLALTVLVVTSSGRLFGWGLALAFSLHMLVDQYQDYQTHGTLDNWFNKTKLGLSGQMQIAYMIIIGLVLVFLAFVS